MRTTPVPFLRIVEAEGEIVAQLFVWWPAGHVPPHGLTTGASVRCTASGVVPSICAKPLALRAERDWGLLARQVVAARPCAREGPTDTRDLKVQGFERGQYFAYGCKNALGSVGPGAEQAAAVLNLLNELLDKARQ
jgi:hypothetical protein